MTFAAAAVSMRATIGFIGSPIWGYLLDRLPLKLAATIQFGMIAVGMFCWLLAASTAALLGGLVLMGFGVSGSGVAAETIW